MEANVYVDGWWNDAIDHVILVGAPHLGADLACDTRACGDAAPNPAEQDALAQIASTLGSWRAARALSGHAWVMGRHHEHFGDRVDGSEQALGAERPKP